MAQGGTKWGVSFPEGAGKAVEIELQGNFDSGEGLEVGSNGGGCRMHQLTITGNKIVYRSRIHNHLSYINFWTRNGTVPKLTIAKGGKLVGPVMK